MDVGGNTRTVIDADIHGLSHAVAHFQTLWRTDRTVTCAPLHRTTSHPGHVSDRAERNDLSACGGLGDSRGASAAHWPVRFDSFELDVRSRELREGSICTSGAGTAAAATKANQRVFNATWTGQVEARSVKDSHSSVYRGTTPGRSRVPISLWPEEKLQARESWERQSCTRRDSQSRGALLLDLHGFIAD